MTSTTRSVVGLFAWALTSFTCAPSPECVTPYYMNVTEQPEGGNNLTRSDELNPHYEACGTEVRRLSVEENSPVFSYPENMVCTNDQDCGEGRACLLPLAWRAPGESSGFAFSARRGLCAFAECRAGSECPSGLCVASFNDCYRVEGFACTTEEDECRVNEDCDDNWNCSFTGQRFECTNSTCERD